MCFPHQARELGDELALKIGQDFDPHVRIGAGIIDLDKLAEIRDSEHEAFRAFSAEATGTPAG